LLLGLAVGTAAAQEVKTAVFTLDTKYRMLPVTPDVPIDARLAGWAGECKIEPGEPIAKLDCPKEPEASEEQNASEKIPATLVLFRDLNEVIFFAGCPVVSDEASGDAPEQGDGPKRKTPKPEDIRDCHDLETGQTFPAVVENGQIKVELRGRQLTLTIFETREKPKTTDSSYIPEPSAGGTPPAPGPATTHERKGLEPQTKAEWKPTELSTPSTGTPSQSSSAGVDPAHTNLRTGRVNVQCPSRQFVVLIDDAYMGNCPVSTPLIAGPHTVTVRRPGQQPQVMKIRVEAGQTLKIDSDQ
jgi:hypothetical protein